MDTFFTILKKTLVGSLFVMVALVTTYVPQQWNQVETVHAGGAGGGYTIPQGVLALVEQAATAIATAKSAAADIITSVRSTSLYIKEYVLDGIAWAVAKSLVSAMVGSLVNWINSGFQGSPMFVQDLQGFLRNAADQAVGKYISELGELGSFICSPFRLDVQIALSLQYQKAREDQPASTCKLTGIIDNIEGFISGTQGSFTQGGWNDWFDITSSPEMYTPLGTTLKGELGYRARIINAKGEELSYLNFGDGFLSGEICEVVQGAGTSKEDCFVSKPGKIIQEALTFNLDTGRESLIAADEIDEVIAALIGQLANTVFTGAAGLLGLSGGTGHTYSGFSAGSYIDAASTGGVTVSSAASPDNVLTLAKQAESFENTFRGVALDYQVKLNAFISNSSTPADKRNDAIAALPVIGSIVSSANNNIAALQTMITTLESPSVTSTQVNDQINLYNSLALHSDEDLASFISEWELILSN